MNREKIRARLKGGLVNAVKGSTWYSIKNAAGAGGEPAEVYIYDEIGWIGHTAQDFMSELKAITAPAITLRVNSPGGEIFDGIAIYNMLRDHPARVVAHVDSLAASIASVIVQAADERVMQPFSQMMIHDGSGMCIGDAAEMYAMYQLLDRQSDNIAAIYNERSGGGAKSWRGKMKAETWYTAEEAVAAGLADRVDRPARQEADALAHARQLVAGWDLTLFRYPGRDHAPAPTNGAETVGQVVAGATPLPDDLEPAIVAPAPRAGGNAPQDELKHCPECDALVAESSLDEHREKEHGATDVLALLTQLTPPSGAVLSGALRAGLEDPTFDADTFRSTLRTLVNEAPATEPTAQVDELVDEVCPECGATAPPGARECPDCGYELEAGDDETDDGIDLGATMAETVASVAAEAPAAEVSEDATPAPDTSGWNAAPEPEPEPTPAQLAAQAIEAVAAEAPAEVAPPAPAPEPPATTWREPEQPPEQTAPANAWSDVGQTIAAAIRMSAERAPAPLTPPAEPAPEIEPQPDPVLLTQSIRQEALR